MRAVRQVCPSCGGVIEFVNGSCNGTGVCGCCDRSIAIAAGVTMNLAGPNETALVIPSAHLSLDHVFPPAITLFRRHAWLLLSMSLWTGLIWFALVGLPSTWLASLWQQAGGELGNLAAVMLATALFGFVAVVVTAYTVAIMARTTLAVARGVVSTVASSASRLSLPSMVLCRMSVLFGLIAGALLLVMALGVLIMVMLSLVWPGERSLMAGVMLAGGMVMLVAGGLQWWLWPAIFLLVDGRSDLWHSVRWSGGLVWRFGRSSLTLVVVYVVITTVGSLLFYVGQILSTPLAMMPLAVAYLRMTGGQTAFSLQMAD